MNGSITTIESLTGDLASVASLSGNITSEASLTGSLSTNIIVGTYEGDYEVTSKPFEDQLLKTENCTLTNDILVKKIPISETTNPDGGITVYIGD